MYSDERNGHGRPHYGPSSKPIEDTFHRLQMESEGKTITVAVQANWRGFFIRVTVEENGWRTSVIVPHSMAAEFRECVETVTSGGPDAKGMVEAEGKVIFVRTDEGDLLMGEKNSRRNGAVVINRAAVGEFRKLLDAALKSPIPGANPRDDRPWKPRLEEKVFYSENLVTDAKTIRVMLKENPMGRYMRIVEGDGLRFTSVMIPVENLEEFRKLVDEAIVAAKETTGT